MEKGTSVTATVDGAQHPARIIRAVTAQREADPPGTLFVCTYRIEITDGPRAGEETHVLPHQVKRSKVKA